LVDARDECRLRGLFGRPNPDEDPRRRWAVEEAVERMAVTTLVRLGAGRNEWPFVRVVG
jgi:hypothetical protein